MKSIRIPHYSVDRKEARKQFKQAGLENQTTVEIDLRGTTFFGMSYIDELMMQLEMNGIHVIYVMGIGGSHGRLLERLNDYAERYGIAVRTAVHRIPKTNFHHMSIYDPEIHGKLNTGKQRKQGLLHSLFAKLQKTSS